MADTISAALAKIDAGTYGICERCAAPIPFARLEAVPYAAYCVTCQAKRPSLLGCRPTKGVPGSAWHETVSNSHLTLRGAPTIRASPGRGPPTAASAAMVPSGAC